MSGRAGELWSGGPFLMESPILGDWRGMLTFTEYGDAIPFRPLRHFLVFGVPADQPRGEHAHRECHQFLVCVAGSCRALVDDGAVSEEVLLDRPSLGLYMPPMIWGTQHDYSADAVLLVLASHRYDEGDYIRDHAEFVAIAAGRRDRPA